MSVNHSAAASLPLIALQRFFVTGFYAARVYLPFSMLAQTLRRFTRRLRGKEVPHEQRTRLPASGWRAFAKSTWAGLVETGKKNGNVRVSEVGVLAHFAADCPRGSMIFEIGTFDGRTSLNMALNACMECEVHTLDLPQDTKPAMALAPGEGHMVDKPVSGARIGAYRDVCPGVVSRIIQHYGDSATFDFSEFEGQCSLVFVDGSHAYDYLISDTKVAMSLVSPGGLVVWHDYGVWPGVTRGLEEIEERDGLGLKNVRGTSLVVWRKP